MSAGKAEPTPRVIEISALHKHKASAMQQTKTEYAILGILLAILNC